jgi:hypothetical protein
MPNPLSGAWIGKTGLCHVIVQRASSLRIKNYDVKGGRLGIEGWGTYLDGKVKLYYEIAGQKQYSDLSLSNNGESKSLIGETNPGQKPSKWDYVGDHCPQGEM